MFPSESASRRAEHRSPALQVGLGGLLLALCTSAPAVAETPALGPDLRGAAGYFRVPVVAASPRGLMLAGGVAYGYTESQVEAPGTHHRLQGRVSASVTPLPWLGVSLGSNVRHDRHAEDDLGPDDGTVIDSDLHGRVGTRVGGDFHVGGGLGASFMRGESVGTSLSSPAVDFQLLAAYLPRDAPFSLGAMAGFRYDMTSGVAVDAARYRAGDRLALGVSEFNAVPLGLGASYRFGQTEVIAELSGDVLLGAGAPALSQSPLRATAGARHQLNEAVALRLLTDTSLSSRPPTGASDPLLPVEPRFQVLVGMAYQVLSWEPEPEVAVVPPPVLKRPEPVAPPPPPPEAVIEVNVTTLEGYPLSDARVTLEIDGEKLEVPHHNLQTYRLDRLTVARGKLRVEADRLQAQSIEVNLGAERPNVFVVQLEPAAPMGQVRGLVRSFNGKGLRARVRIEPLGTQVRTEPDGTFEVDVTPGRYEVVIEAAGHETQRRSVKVERDGVVVLNADLLRGKR